MTQDKFSVAIVGGGLCGVACAVGLLKLGIKSTVFEATPKFGEVGAGVGLGPNALRALEGLGILDAVMARVEDKEFADRRSLFVSGHGTHETVYDYENSTEWTVADAGLAIHRAAFLDALVPLLDPQTTQFNKRCSSITTLPSGVHRIHFTDGTTHDADLVVGADGIRSTTRGAVVDESAADKLLQFTNTVAYRGLVPTEALVRDGLKTDLTKRLHMFLGIDKHLVVFPIKSGKIINIVAFSTDNSVPVGSVAVPGPWVQPVPQQELLDEYAGWGPDVRIMLNHMKTPSKWFIHALKPLDTFIRGRIALVGDAAHSMCPHLGSGVGQGFEDVYVLCQLLAHPSTNLSNLEDVLRAYDTVRRPRANMVLERSFRAGVIYESFGKPGYGLQDMEGHLAGIWEPIWRHDLSGDISTAMAALSAS
ncbi:FAD/NAD-P-binding domain-containing protein [Roridomyces roridus]|uniref:FAD/NAD-P-binding domain-containing protein n=1 Tax=Roridomyces roridus TaxID=1738132 RepID=A0AAD7FA16_9AGAR|nr:FAD/NAD-P-binding domain-containing protein [Roridomyces roridus]